jgi:hypothetical protein
MSIRAALVMLTLLVAPGGCRRMIGPAGPGAGADGASPDAAPARRCSGDDDCASRFCGDGICCDRPCAGPCEACTRAATGVADGVCAPVMAGVDPHDDCADETMVQPCGRDGTCDGAGACRLAPRGRQCAPPACLDAHTFASAGSCDGAGVCLAGVPIDCGAYPCRGDGCAKPCADNSGCPNGSACVGGRRGLRERVLLTRPDLLRQRLHRRLFVMRRAGDRPAGRDVRAGARRDGPAR